MDESTVSGTRWLRLLYRLVDIFSDIAYRCLSRANIFLDVAFDFKALVTKDFANDLFHLALNFFCSSFDLIFVHGPVPLCKFADSLCGKVRLNVIVALVCSITNPRALFKETSTVIWK